MEVWLIRHGATRGNREGRYVGRTDEGLSREGRQELLALAGAVGESESFPGSSREPGRSPDMVVASPMLRCIQTARILFPGQEPVLCRELAEMDFGEFEYKNYRELNGDPRYQAYLDSGGTLGFPGGENPEDFKKRCLLGYHRMVEKARAEQRKTVAFVVHGGTIMAILEQYGIPEKPYFDWQVKNGACIGGQVADTGDLKIAVALPENIRYNRNGV